MGFHRVWALVVLALLLVAVVVGLVALGRGWEHRYALYLRICTAAIGIQALVGIALLLSGERPRAGLHFLFGPVALVTLPVAARLAERRPETQRGRVLVGGAGFTFVLALLSLVTGGGAA